MYHPSEFRQFEPGVVDVVVESCDLHGALGGRVLFSWSKQSEFTLRLQEVQNYYCLCNTENGEITAGLSP